VSVFIFWQLQAMLLFCSSMYLARVCTGYDVGFRGVFLGVVAMPRLEADFSVLLDRTRDGLPIVSTSTAIGRGTRS